MSVRFCEYVELCHTGSSWRANLFDNDGREALRLQERTLSRTSVSFMEKRDVKAAIGKYTRSGCNDPFIRKRETYWSSRSALTENSGHSR